MTKDNEMESYFIDTSLKCFRDACQKDLSPDIGGKVIEKQPDCQYIAPHTLIHHSLERWKEATFNNECMQ